MRRGATEIEWMARIVSTMVDGRALGFASGAPQRAVAGRRNRPFLPPLLLPDGVFKAPPPPPTFRMLSGFLLSPPVTPESEPLDALEAGNSSPAQGVVLHPLSPRNVVWPGCKGWSAAASLQLPL